MAVNSVISPNALKRRRILVAESADRTVDRIRKSADQKARLGQKFDFFISHSHADREQIAAFIEFMEASGFSVYVDWIIDKNRSGEKISKENAAKIKERMKQCDRMVYIHTPNAIESKWCPWEIGLFDEMKDEVYVALISEQEKNTTGQEYLDLYPRFRFTGNYSAPLKADFGYETDAAYEKFS